MFPPSSDFVSRIALRGLPHQTTESVTIVDLSCSFKHPTPEHPVFETDCSGNSSIVIPGIGQGRVNVLTHTEYFVRPVIIASGFGRVSINGLPGQTSPSLILLSGQEFTGTVDIHGIGSGQATVITNSLPTPQ